MSGWEEAVSRRDVLKAGAAVGAGLLVGAGAVESATAAPNSAAWSKVVKAAKEEGAVNYYTTNADLAEILQPAFQKAYPGISLGTTIATQNTLQARLITEVATGSAFADVVDSRALQIPAYHKAKAIVAADLPNVSRLGSLRAPGNLLFPTYQVAIAAYVNTKMLPKNTDLGDLSVLADPKYKGMIGMDDPLNYSSGWNILASRRALWGEAKFETWLKGLKANGIQTFPGSSDVYQAIVEGQLALGFDSLNDFLTQKKGTPDAVIWYGHIVFFQLGVSLANKAEHPNAGKVFANWLLSADGQRQFSKSGRFPVLPPPGSLNAKRFLPKGASIMPLSKLQPYFDNPKALNALACGQMHC